MAEARQYAKSQAQRPKADVLLVTTTEVEAKAVLCVFPKWERCCIDDKIYYDLGIVGDARIFMVQSEMGSGGPGGSLFTVSEGIRALSPGAVIMVGIAFGVNPVEQSIGDILVSTQIRDLNPQRVGTSITDQTDIQLRGERASASIRLLDRFKAGSKDWPAPPKIQFGLVLSQEKLIDHVGYRDQLLQLEPEAIGGEMEGAGLYAAAQRYKVDWILVKAICDWADGNKKRQKCENQQRAAENAACFTLQVIERGGLSSNTSEPEIPARGTLLCSYDIHSSWVLALAWEPAGNRIASAGGDGTVQIWHAGTGQHLLTYRGHAPTGLLSRTKFVPTVYALAWSPTEASIASCGNGKTVHIWNADTGGTNLIYRGHSGLLPNVYAIAWSPDGTRIVSACSSTGIDKTVHVWDVKTGQTLLRYDPHLGLTPNFSVLAAAWSPDGTRIASTFGDRTIRVWGAANGEPISTYATHAEWVSSIAWSPDGRWLATANSDSTAQIWDTLTGEVMLTYSGHADSVRDIAWSPDGRQVASASNDKTVQIWDATTGNHVFTYRGHTDWTTAVVWSSDGTRIASGSNDKTVRVWQAG